MPMTKKTSEKEKTDAKKPEKTPEVEPEQSLRNEIENLSNEAKEQNDKLLRCLADFDNYKKRITKERQSSEFQMKKKYLLEILDIKELILQAKKDTNPKQGLRIILNQLDKFFESENIKYIECVEKPFDFEYHHAMTTVEKQDCEDNIIIEEIKKGYLVEDKVLRPSQVIVVKKKCEED